MLMSSKTAKCVKFKVSTEIYCSIRDYNVGVNVKDCLILDEWE